MKTKRGCTSLRNRRALERAMFCTDSQAHGRRTDSRMPVAIARIRALPEVNPLRQNRVLVRVIDQDGHWVVDLMELPADAPHRQHVEKAWNHNALLDIQEDDEDEAGLHLFTKPESL